jgi:hypothetical protein
VSATIVKERLQSNGFKRVRVKKKSAIGEIIAEHYEVTIDLETVCFIHRPLACHSFNTIRIGKKKVKIATIDTMLSFYLAFSYANRPYYDKARLLCMSEYLFKVQSKNRLKQKGLLKQITLEDIRAEKSEVFAQLKDKRNSKEFEKHFLRYVPNKSKKKTVKVNKKVPKKTKKQKTKRFWFI